MLSLRLDPAGESLRLLALGAHSDDIEIGAGGTILQLVDRFPNMEVCWVVFAGDNERVAEAQASATAFLKGVSQRRVIVHSFPDGFLPFHGEEVKKVFEGLKSFTPDLILTHYRHDLHQDHRLVSDLTWNTFRNHLLLEYEIPKYDGDMGSPNVFMPLSQEACERKVELLLQSFPSQHCKPWFTPDLFLSLLRLRGMEAASPTSYSEAFYGRKVVL